MPDIWVIISLLLSVIALAFTFYVWKNPVDVSFKVIANLKDDDDRRINYQIGVHKNKWQVLKIDLNKSGTGKGLKSIADQHNNPSYKTAPGSLKKIKDLNYREYS